MSNKFTRHSVVTSGGVSLSLDVAPVAKGRPRFGRGHAYTPGKTLAFERSVARLARLQYRGKPMHGAIRLTVSFLLAKPKSSKNDFPVVRPDLDNYFKAVTDALNGILWVDDSQIVETRAIKVYADKPEIHVLAEPLGVALVSEA